MRNIVLQFSFRGNNFSGWQVQKNKTTVCGTLENSLYEILGEEVKLSGCGRLDAGVHALVYYANFKTTSDYALHSLVGRLNHVLHPSIRIANAYEVDNSFDARKSALSKTYCYYFYQSQKPNAYLDTFATHYYQDIDIKTIESNLQKIIGEHDFSSFCASGAQVQSKVRTLYSARLIKEQNCYGIELTGNGFLYNMVRIIVGTLIDIASGKLDASIPEILNAKDRTKAGHTAQANGLVLTNVQYTRNGSLY